MLQDLNPVRGARRVAQTALRQAIAGVDEYVAVRKREGVVAGRCWREAFVLAMGVADADDADALLWPRVAQHVRARSAS